MRRDDSLPPDYTGSATVKMQNCPKQCFFYHRTPILRPSNTITRRSKPSHEVAQGRLLAIRVGYGCQRIFRPYRAFVFFGAEPRVTLRSTLGYPISPRWGFGRVDCSPMGLVGKRCGGVLIGFVGGTSLMKRLPEARNGAHAIAHGREYFAPTGLLFLLALNPG